MSNGSQEFFFFLSATHSELPNFFFTSKTTFAESSLQEFTGFTIGFNRELHFQDDRTKVLWTSHIPRFSYTKFDGLMQNTSENNCAGEKGGRGGWTYPGYNLEGALCIIFPWGPCHSQSAPA